MSRRDNIDCVCDSDTCSHQEQQNSASSKINEPRSSILDNLINAPFSELHKSQIEITRSHLYNNPLYSGSKFTGCQKSRGHSYEVEVTFKVRLI